MKSHHQTDVTEENTPIFDDDVKNGENDETGVCLGFYCLLLLHFYVGHDDLEGP